MTYALLALLGAAVASGGLLWYYIARLRTDESTIAAQSQANKVDGTKIKTLDDRIVDSEYARRAAERKANANDTPAIIGELLTRSGTDDDVN